MMKIALIMNPAGKPGIPTPPTGNIAVAVRVLEGGQGVEHSLPGPLAGPGQGSGFFRQTGLGEPEFVEPREAIRTERARS
jgi:hypothetical protein